MIDEFLNDKKLSLELNMGENGSNLSGGQKQRIGIARGIYRKSDILIFDESTSALDYETESKLLNNIFKELKNQTIIFITHRKTSLKMFSKVYEFKKKNIRLIKN